MNFPTHRGVPQCTLADYEERFRGRHRVHDAIISPELGNQIFDAQQVGSHRGKYTLGVPIPQPAYGGESPLMSAEDCGRRRSIEGYEEA